MLDKLSNRQFNKHQTPGHKEFVKDYTPLLQKAVYYLIEYDLENNLNTNYQLLNLPIDAVNHKKNGKPYKHKIPYGNMSNQQKLIWRGKI